MKSRERLFLKRNLIAILGLIIVFVVCWIGIAKVMGTDFTDYLFVLDSQSQYNELEPNQLKLEFDQDNIVNLESVEKKDGQILYTLSPINSGQVSMTIYNADNDEKIREAGYCVLPSGTIVDFSTGNFTNYRVYHLMILLFCVALTVVLWLSFAYVQKVLMYSYQSIFFSGLAIWMTLISALFIRVWFMEEIMLNVYGILKMAAINFMIISFPFMLVFCIALSISNIQLIRKEGFQIRNALGIVISFAMISGVAVAILLFDSFSSGSEMQIRLHEAFTGIYSSIYAFLECFLIGSILCGTLAARHKPKYDMDYLIILGCQIKPDGGLYPLIQARVDRAIEFYKKQLEKTGKKAMFIPSGGQGTDEVISEAEAMKRYLLEKGIPEEQILVEDKSKNTAQNMCFSKKIIEERTSDAKAAFSTTNFHVFRSGIISRQTQFEPEGMGSKTKWYFWPNAYIREVIGMMAYKWKSIIITLIPIIAFFFAIQFVG